MTDTSHVELLDVSRTFPDTGAVVERLRLSLREGEFVSFLGPSGCGKSTLLRLIAGLDQPDEGEVRVEDRGSARGFVFQDSHLLPWRDVLDNAALPLELMGRKKSEARASARTALEKVGLLDAVAKYPNQLSGGMKMRVSVARALVTRPKLLLLDEPFAALDENTRFRLQEDLRVLWAEEGMTVVFVTHSVSEAVFLSDRVIVFSPRPARVLLDRKVELPRKRDRELRNSPAYWREIEAVGKANQ